MTLWETTRHRGTTGWEITTEGRRSRKMAKRSTQVGSRRNIGTTENTIAPVGGIRKQ